MTQYRRAGAGNWCAASVGPAAPNRPHQSVERRAERAVHLALLQQPATPPAPNPPVLDPDAIQPIWSASAGG
jgi:hypothetical protein